MRLPSLRYLRTFQVAARHLSFKNAADELAVTASAVSHQIKNLETWLQLPLFERRTRSLALTDAGRQYAEFLNAMFSRLESETQQIRSQYGRPVLRLFVPSFFASEALLPRMSEFQRAAVFDLRVQTQPSAMNVHSSEADVSILLGNGHWPGLTVHRLFERQVIVAASQEMLARAHVEDYAALNGCTFIVHDSRPDEWSLWAREVGVDTPRPGKILRFDTMSGVVRAAEQGLGLALVSWPLARDWFGNGSLVRVFDEEVPTGESFFMAYRHDEGQSSEVQTLCKWMLSQFGGYRGKTAA